MSSTLEPTTSAQRRRRRGRSTTVTIALLLVPILVLGQFALLAVIPLATALVATMRTPQLRRLRPWTAALAVVYLVPLVLWLALPDREPSLSKAMHPAFYVLIPAVGLAVLVRHYTLGRGPDDATNTAR